MPAGADIVWLASYPKSGNTWLRLLLANLLSGSGEPVDINRVELTLRTPVGRIDVEDMTLIDTGLLTPDEADQLRPRVVEGIVAEAAGRCCIKVHDAFRMDTDGEPLLGLGAARAALYVVRDPRDVAVSFAHHRGGSIDKTIAAMNSVDHSMGNARDRWNRQLPQRLLDWSGHVLSWTGQRHVPTHVIRYEDLRADPVGTFGAAVAFLGLDVPPGAVGRAVRFAAFDELQRQEQRSGFCERQPESTAPFFRSGRAGAWAEVLSPAQADAIVAAHGRVMKRFGYRDEPPGYRTV